MSNFQALREQKRLEISLNPDHILSKAKLFDNHSWKNDVRCDMKSQEVLQKYKPEANENSRYHTSEEVIYPIVHRDYIQKDLKTSGIHVVIEKEEIPSYITLCLVLEFGVAYEEKGKNLGSSDIIGDVLREKLLERLPTLNHKLIEVIVEQEYTLVKISILPF